tara:strand:- start:497 stop:1231 length:735 start_codon:yes stop_codon:yes gene_type:complete
MPALKKLAPEKLAPDQFLGDILGKPAWRVTKPIEITPELFRAGPDGFAYAKVECVGIPAIAALEKAGFNLIDTNTQFDRFEMEPWPEVELPSDYCIRFAEPSDAEAVAEIAATSFVCSRFHLDSLISDTVANDIKRYWAGNFFKGKRGDWMVVLTFYGEVVGFLQLLSKGGTIIIDLIAVGEPHRSKGLAGAMIVFAAKQCGEWARLLVGTQVSNIPSARAYEKLGFRMCASSYVFHYHGPMRI